MIQTNENDSKSQQLCTLHRLQHLLSRRHCRSCDGRHVGSRYLHWAKQKASLPQTANGSNRPNLCVSMVCDVDLASLRRHPAIKLGNIQRNLSLLHAALKQSVQTASCMGLPCSQIDTMPCDRSQEHRHANLRTHSSNHPNLAVSIVCDDRTRSRCGRHPAIKLGNDTKNRVITAAALQQTSLLPAWGCPARQIDTTPCDRSQEHRHRT